MCPIDYPSFGKLVCQHLTRIRGEFRHAESVVGCRHDLQRPRITVGTVELLERGLGAI